VSKTYQFKVVEKYPYKKIPRDTKDNKRTYNLDGKHIPSVTTILSETKDKSFLESWKKRIGEEKAREVTLKSSNRGTEMHKVIECTLLGLKYENSDPEASNAVLMAHKIMDNMQNINEIWGSEISLHYKDKWAGTADLVCLMENQPTIGDFKQANKPKRQEWIDDYFCQLVAYSMAHKELYGEIIQGKIFMCTPDLVFQSFDLNNINYNHYEKLWLNRVDQYYEKFSNANQATA